MERVNLPGFEAFPNPRDGFEMDFSGSTPDAEGNPTGEHVSIKLVVPPPSFRILQQIQARQKARTAPTTEDSQSDVIDTILYSLARNYRGVPRWLVEQSIDGPFMTAMNARMKEMMSGSDEKKAPTSP